MSKLAESLKAIDWKHEILSRVCPVFIPVLFMLIIQILESCNFGLYKYFGLRPLTFQGLYQIFTAPWIHFGWEHFSSNMSAWFPLASLLMCLGRKTFWITIVWIVIVGGLLTWLIGAIRGGIVAGASGVLFGLFGFLGTSAIFVRPINWKHIAVLVIVFTYFGGLIWGVLPSNTPISWEGHLSGLIAGVSWSVCHYRFKWFNVVDESEQQLKTNGELPMTMRNSGSSYPSKQIGKGSSAIVDLSKTTRA